MRKVLKVCGLLLLGITTACPFSARADDSWILSLMYSLQNTQLPMLQDLTMLSDIKSNGLQTANNLQGNFGYGQLFNTAKDLAARQWSNNSWFDVMNMVNGNNTNSAFYQAQQQYAQRYQTMNPNQFGAQPGVSTLNQQYYSDNSQMSRAALAASAYSYNLINQHMQTVSQILAALENNPSEKASADLNARLVAEQSFIALEQLRMQNFQTQLSASHAQADANGMSDQASFMQWNPH